MNINHQKSHAPQPPAELIFLDLQTSLRLIVVSGITFDATLVRCLARNFNRIKVAFQGLGGGEALLNRRIVTSEATVNIAEEVTACSNQSGAFVFPFG